jgi:hypothetical protein
MYWSVHLVRVLWLILCLDEVSISSRWTKRGIRSRWTTRGIPSFCHPCCVGQCWMGSHDLSFQSHFLQFIGSYSYFVKFHNFNVVVLHTRGQSRPKL